MKASNRFQRVPYNQVMRHARSLALIGLLVAALLPTAIAASAQQPALTTLVRDINPGRLGVGSSPRELALLGERVAFSADDGIHGQELWVSDGSATGTTLVKDIRPGPAGSVFGLLVNLGERILFVADDGEHGSELWTSDGTAAGTQLVRDFTRGAAGTLFYGIAAAGARAFVILDEGNGPALWLSDGTAIGTVRLIALAFPQSLTAAVVGDQLLVGVSSYGEDRQSGTLQLFRSDGTASGTIAIATLAAVSGTAPFPDLPTARFLGLQAGRQLIAVSTPATALLTFWASDGTASGTTPLPVEPGDRIREAALFGQQLLTLEDWPGEAVLLANGLPLLRVPRPPNQWTMAWLTVNRSGAWFTARNGAAPWKLWRSDGTPAGTTAVAPLPQVSIGDQPPVGPVTSPLYATDDAIFFLARDATSGYELWRSDGTAGGTTRLIDSRPGGDNGNYRELLPIGERLFFTLDDRGPLGKQLWVSDGSAAGTRVTRAINQESIPASSNPSGFADLGGRVLFFADDGVHGIEPWISDGSASGTTLLTDLVPGPDSFLPTYGVEREQVAVLDLGARALFRGVASEGAPRLWVSDGTASGTKPLRELGNGDGAWLATPEGAFIADGSTLLVTDGIAAGTTQRYRFDTPILDLDAAGELLIITLERSSGYEVWAQPLRGVEPPRLLRFVGFLPAFGLPVSVAGSSFYFVEWLPGDPDQQLLWRGDGATGVLNQVRSFRTIDGRAAPVAVGNSLFFAASTEAGFGGLWASDGTAAGTRELLRLPASGVFSGVSGLRVADGLVYFNWLSGAENSELWRSDGTPEGTIRLASGLFGTEFVAIPDAVAFVGVSIWETGVGTTNALWHTDGTPGGTRLVQDIADSPLFTTRPHELTRLGSQLLFSMGNANVGRELFAAPAKLPAPVLTPRSYLPLISRSNVTGRTQVDHRDARVET